MPSPFPGMDPYLESADWRSFHTQFCGEIGRTLVPMLRPKYFVRAEKNYILADADTDTDTNTGQPQLPSRRSPDMSIGHAGRDRILPAAASALLEPPVRLALSIPDEVPQVTIEILDVADRTLVSAIEVLFPTNKRGMGRQEYLAKRRHLLHSPAHLIEIDLLRTGSRLPMSEPLPPADYYVIASRADRRPVGEVWPISLRSTLPTVPIPLLPGDRDVLLDLQGVFVRTYSDWALDLDVDYSKPPAVPLSETDQAWAARLLSNLGLN